MTSRKRPKPIAPEILEAGLPDRQDAPDYRLRVREFERLLREHLHHNFTPARAARLTLLYEELRNGERVSSQLQPDTIRKDRRLLERACAALVPLAIAGLLAFRGTPEMDARTEIEWLRHEVESGLDALEDSLEVEDRGPVSADEAEAELLELERRLGIARAGDAGDPLRPS